MKYILPCVAIMLAFTVKKGFAQNKEVAFASETFGKMTWIRPAKLAYLNATTRDNRVLLNWAIENNKETNMFEVERSTDGKTFKMVGLVFGSELSELAEYRFFEKLRKGKTFYRLKVIYKNNKAEYSDIIIP